MASPTVTDIHGLVDTVVGQAQGKPLTTVDLSTAISVASKTFTTRPGELVGALVQRIGQTIYPARPYARKFPRLLVDNQTWGNITAKTTPLPMQTVEDKGLPSALTDGSSVDMWKINKRKFATLYYMDQHSYDYSESLFRDQMRTVFTSAAEFARWTASVATARANDTEQAKESMARATLCNLVGGVLVENNPKRVIKLLSEYNKQTGLTLTSETVYQPANFAPFMRWAWGRIQTVSKMFTELTGLYHTNLSGIPDIVRHTPIDKQRLYMYSPLMDNVATSVMSTTFHDEYLQKMGDVEEVNFWQAAEKPDTINIQATYLQPTGTIKTAACNRSNIVGVLMDMDAAFYTIFDEVFETTPYNTRGRYWNLDQHHQARWCNDFTENAVVFLME